MNAVTVVFDVESNAALTDADWVTTHTTFVLTIDHH